MNDSELAHNAANFEKLRVDLRSIERFGEDYRRELTDGRIRYYGRIKPALKPGEMKGARLVREWNCKNNQTRTWYETLDQKGRIRIVRPDPTSTGGEKKHYKFSEQGEYLEVF